MSILFLNFICKLLFKIYRNVVLQVIGAEKTNNIYEIHRKSYSDRRYGADAVIVSACYDKVLPTVTLWRVYYPPQKE